MTPAARLQAAIELIASIEAEKSPADAVADAFFRARRYAGAKDRRAVAAAVFGVLRHRAKLDWWIGRSPVANAITPRSHVLAGAMLIDGKSAAEVAGLCSNTKYAPVPLARNEEELLQSLEGRPLVQPDMPVPVRLECPPWLEARLRRAWAGRFESELEAMNQPAPLDLRANTLLASRDEVRRRLAAEGLESAPTPLSPVGLRLAGRSTLARLNSFREGWIEVQDEGSQLVALLTDARPGHSVADVCAGGGGKTLALAVTMRLGQDDADGRLVAGDVSEPRLERLRKRLRRNRLGRIETRLLAAEADPWIAANQNTFDRVLVDAPCSGTGTWRRNPDARWRLTESDLGCYAKAQASILPSAAGLVKASGRLAYVTCSVLREENEDQIEAFLAMNPNFEPVPADILWRDVLGGIVPSAGPYLRLSPAATGTDGFFMAVLRRRD